MNFKLPLPFRILQGFGSSIKILLPIFFRHPFSLTAPGQNDEPRAGNRANKYAIIPIP